jgi:hypothetical protein
VGTGGSGAGGAGTGGSGAGGSGAGGAGTGGSGAGGSGAGGSTAGGGNSVLERNNHPSRDGAYVQPTLTKAMVTRMASDTGFQATFTGGMRASPLYLENGPNNKGVFFAATAANNVVALDETTGAMVWTKSVGMAPAASGTTCGDIRPIGIISTPVIDAQARTIFVAGAVGTSSIMTHQVHALSVDDGSERTGGWPVDVSKVTSGSVTFSPVPQNQRSALSLVNGIIYVAYGGHNGDCGTYHGWMVAINSANPTTVAGWATSGEGDAIWAAGGMASDGNGVFATTGDNHPRLTTHMDSEEVIRITGMAVADKSNQNLFYPTEWLNMDNTDADFSANSPVYIEVPDPSGTTRTYVVAITKDGSFYVLNSKNLGGMGGQVAKLTIATGGAMVVHTVPAAYTTSNGVHVTFTTDSGAQCPTGMPSGTVVMSVLIPAGATPAPHVVWCASTGKAGAQGESGPGSNLPASPMITTTDGKSDAMVWFMNSGKLTAVDGDTGKVLYTSSDTCTGVKQWTAPIAVKGHIVAGGDGHLCSWSLH